MEKFKIIPIGISKKIISKAKIDVKRISDIEKKVKILSKDDQLENFDSDD